MHWSESKIRERASVSGTAILLTAKLFYATLQAVTVAVLLQETRSCITN